MDKGTIGVDKKLLTLEEIAMEGEKCAKKEASFPLLFSRKLFSFIYIYGTIRKIDSFEVYTHGISKGFFVGGGHFCLPN